MINRKSLEKLIRTSSQRSMRMLALADEQKSFATGQPIVVLRKRKLGSTDTKRGFQPLKYPWRDASGNVIESLDGPATFTTALKLGGKESEGGQRRRRES